MPAVKISENVYYVGSIDYDVRSFHGYKTPFGTTYNSYLILDEKITLVDFVKAPFSDDLIKNIEEIVPLSKIDYMICNHVEPDHSGALPVLAELLPNAKIFATANGEKGLKAYYKKDFNLQVVKANDTLCTGKFTFTFIPMPMVHWPDSMSTYLAEEKILFSNDAFGQHIATKERFDDEIGLERLLERAGNYYANIVFPFGAQVQKLLNNTSSLDIKTICPSHGVVLRSYIPEIIEKYKKWSANITDDKRAVVIYDTMWGSTRILADRIADDFESKGIHATKIDLEVSHISEAISEVLESKYIAVGSSTLNRNVLPPVAAFLTYMKGLEPKNRIGLAFGSYGWSGESIPDIENCLKSMGFEMLESIKAVYRP